MLGGGKLETSLRAAAARPIWGRVLGTLVGLSAGPFGAGLGFLVGYLVDHMRMRRDLGAMLAECFAGPRPLPLAAAAESSIGLPVEVVVFVGLGVRVVVSDGLVRDLHLGTLQREIRERYPRLTARARQIEATMQEAVVLGSRIEVVRLSSLLAEHSAVLRTELFSSLVRVALSEGLELTPARVRVLEQCGAGLGLNPEEIGTMLQPLRRLNAEACAILGVERDIDLGRLRKVYRRLASEFHPDLAQSLSEDQQRMTNEAFLRIREAYVTLCRELGEE